ncbi:AAA family ATPase [Actinoplanes sp. TBRC 11911]|uniref:BTAD domain-containing putative transcriptional regulator n=1 Tax=Actinoplanes sp. TBRC 11911 TaxID=2729386 RepID=UPI00145C7B6C|nr:BTAD domain-containing putative transcriptional regulator [Actinoplanes sp. TBRC 11911]NMO53891.1 AAA family ATPase [Actinoplanes sp. TBRC 11911]
MGRFAVLRDGVEIDESAFHGRKARQLLRVLATRQCQFVPNDVLAAALWPERPPANPSANLQVLVNRARRAVGRAELIRTGPGGYALAGPPDCTVDTELFLAAVDRAGRAQGAPAFTAYRDALATVAEPLAEDTYADWARAYRERVLQSRQIAWERAAALAVDLGDLVEAVEYASTAAGAEPLREAAALALVRALAAAGDRAAALAEFDRYRRAIAEELGIDPSPQAAELHRFVLRSDVPDRRNLGRPVEAEFQMLRFVGRDEVVRQVIARLPAGAVQIAGRSGTGKSRLIEAVAEAVPALVVAAHWADRDEPWSLGRTLLRAVLADADQVTLPERLRAAVAQLLPEFDQPSNSFDPETRNALVLEAARRLLASGPKRVVIVDDLQWADASSVRLLRGVACRVDGPRVILAYRPDEVSVAVTAEMLRRLPGQPAITLGGLGESALAELIDDAATVAAVAGETDRTPMAVAEALRVLHAEGLMSPDRGGRWHATGDRAAERARAIGRAGQRRAIANRAATHDGPVLRLLALLGREAAVPTLAAAADLSLPDTLGVLDELAAAGLVRLGDRGWRTVHDMVAEVVVAELSDGTRARLHARLATVLGEERGDLTEQARHWLGAGEAVRAAEAYARAAAHALDQVADAEAEHLAAAGLATGGASGGVQAGLFETRAQARRRRGDIPAARDDLRAALTGFPAGPARARVLAELAVLDSGADDLRRAAEIAELALVEAGADDDARAAALEVASVIDMNLDRAARAEARAAEALAIYTRTGDSRGAARILDARAMAAFLHGSIEDGVAELDRAAHLFESSGDLMRTVTPRSTCGHGRVLLGRAAAGLADTERALDVARTLGHPEGETYALWHRSEARSALGRSDEALADGRSALAIAQRINHRGWTATAWRAVGIAHQCRGDLPAALAAFRHSLEHSANLDLFSCWAAARAALACIGLKRLDEAAELVEHALSTGPALGRHEARWAAAELAVACDDTDAPTVIRAAIAAASTAGARLYLPRLTSLNVADV